ncbi:glycosyltransferase family 1 protein [uncultured Tateyamaria sp.]|uniref:glycosyltransferase family 4 protein n=1 Tax=uncultured Tateyamaria sp. TaxID=455651 RepID=UPI0026381965|nr:glycosyltransferase family 1 protein [uncultured Tateyamaria sp.]
MTKIAYDLSEVFSQSTGKDQFYGIARVVAEIAYGLFRSEHDVTFVLYSPGHAKFFEIVPTWDEKSYAGINLNVPTSAKPMKFRNIYKRGNLLRDLLSPAIGAVIRFKNRERWRKSGIELKEVKLDGYSFFSAGRPKLIIDMVHTIRTRGWNTKSYVLLHDFFPFHDVDERHQSRFAASFHHDNSFLIPRTDVIVPNSYFTANDLEHFAGNGTLPKPKDVKVLQLAQHSIHSGEHEEIFLPDRPYFMCVGTLLGRKNLDIVLDAMMHLHETGREVPLLILAGQKRSSVVRHLDKPELEKIRKQIRFVVHPNQTDLNRLYQNAIATIIPSKMEGWGLPAGEALHLGCPVISSTADALVECCGDLGVFFDPDDKEQLADLMEKFATDQEYRDSVRDKIVAGKDSLRSWDTVAAELIEIMEA